MWSALPLLLALQSKYFLSHARSREDVKCDALQSTIIAVFRRIRSGPCHSAGSGSTSGNVDPDPGAKKIVINSHKNQPKLSKYNFFKKSLFCLLHLNIKHINSKKKSYEYYIFYGKIKKTNMAFVRFQVGSGSTIPRSRFADPDPHQNETDPKPVI